MKRSEPHTIGSAIEKTLKSLGLEKKLRQYDVLELWSSVVGEKIAQVTVAESIRDGKLFITVTRSTWRNELVFLKKELIARINATMKQEVVKDIIFR